MKKLLSICFLSILLGLLSFSAQAQNCGFLIKNLQPDTIPTQLGITEGVAQMSPDGLLPLDHTLGSGVFINPNSPLDYYGNANVGRTELYELFLCNTCNLAPKTKVSLDWILQRWNDATGQWETVNGNLSDYVDFDIYTLYSEINDTTGVCNRITWLGGRVPNGFGWCEQTVAPDMFHGITCHTPTNYPGALPVGQGTPYSVMNQLGELIPAMGMTPIYTEALDYFYYDFFSQTRTLLQLKWKQVGNYRLIMNLRERLGGTAWNNLTWNENETTDFIGGHQSCCGPILATDTIGYPVFDSVKHAVCEDNIWEYGRPLFTFNEPVNGVYPNNNFDTLVVFGEVIGTGDCSVFHTDSIHYVEFFVRHTPVMQIANDTLCRCATFTEDDLFDLATQDVSSPDHPVITIQWQVYDPLTHKYTWTTDVPSISSLNIPGINYFTVRQINTYDDTLDCVSEPVTFSVLFKEMTPPEINTPELTDFCLEALEGATVTLSAELDEECANTVRWFTAFLPTASMQFNWLVNNNPLFAENHFSEYLDPASYIGSNELTVNLADYMPSTNKDTVLYFFAVSYQDTTCPSPQFSYITINLHQTPVLSKSTIKDVYCVSDEVVMTATVTTTQTDQPYTFNWTGITAVNIAGEHVLSNGKTVVEVAGTPKQSTPKMPVYLYKDRNYSQQIFTPAEVPAGTITKLAFNWANATSKKTSNVEIYLGTTDKNSFESKADFVTSNLQLVYTGGLNSSSTGWKELNFTTPYNYNGAENLVLVVKDNSGQSEPYDNKYFVCTQTPDHKSMTIATDGTLPADPTTYTGTVYRWQYRSDVKFTVTPAVYANADTVYNQLDPENECGHAYSTSVYVVDANGCVSEPVQFDYTGNDTIAPVVTPATRVTRVEGCNVNENNWVLYNNLAAFAQAGIVVKDDAVELNDNCGLPYVTFTHADTHFAGPCEDTIVRVYTFTDKCGKTATFSDTIIARDTQKPFFRDPVTNQSPYIRMLPVRDMNCTYNAPEKSAFVHAILPVVGDNCTTMDSLWLMDHATFYWENSELFNQVLAPGTINIFGPHVGNQLTVKVVIEDACGNADTAMILYFNRPDSLEILPPSITVDPANICLGETATLTFDPSKVDYDGDDFDVATPLTYAWSNLEHLVDLTDATDAEITVTPTIGDTIYHFQVTVTDAYGCTATSEYAPLFVKDNPHVKIIKDVRNGAVEPYCPNYGDLTIVAVDAATETKIPNLIYTWSGESVNVNASIEDTSFIVIVPDYCDQHYTAYVHVVDSIYGCVGDDSITVWAADTAGPEYTGNVINDTVDIMPQCKMYVPDFIHYLNNANIIDNCYAFSEFYESFRQDPPAGTEMTEDTPVTIYVTTPCQEAEYPIVNKFFARVPDNHLKVAAAVAPTHACEPAEFTFTATPTDGAAPITYSWTKANSTWTANGQVVTVSNEMVATGAIVSVYTYTVEAVDALNCHATASVNDTVYMTVLDIDTATYPNTNCLAPWNGQLVVFHAPVGTHYELSNDGFYMERISEVPGWDTLVRENTLIFDYLPEGDYILTVTTSHNCVSTFDIHIRGAYTPVEFNNEATPHDPTYCTNDNGYITLVPEAGYTYEVYSPAGLLLGYPYTDLTVGDYTIIKTSVATRCKDTTTVHIGFSQTTMTFPVDSSANTLCGDEVYNGKVIFNASGNNGWTYVVTNEAGTTIYEGGPAQLTTLPEGTYTVYGHHTQTGCEYQKTATVNNGRNNPVFTVTTTPNNYCENEDGLVNGAITMTPATTYTYTVTTGTGADLVTVTNLAALAAGDYHVVALNESNQCWSDTNVTIYDELYYPIVDSVKLQENTSCDPEVLAYNGAAQLYVGVDVDNVVIVGGTCNYTVDLSNVPSYGWHGAALTFVQNGATVGTYTITGTYSDNAHFTVPLASGVPTQITYTPGTQSNQNIFSVKDQSGAVVWSKGRYEMNLGATTTITPNCTSVNPVTAFNNKIKPYTVEFVNDDEQMDVTTTFNNSPASFNQLNSGVYNYTITTKYLCKVEGEVEIEQHKMPNLLMHATPNTMCEPTFEKPGNGTIVMDSATTEFGHVYYRDPIFDYSFYFASTTPAEGFESVDGYYPGTQLQVNYWVPISYTMYYLADSLYYVMVYDRLTGCDVADTITVPKGLDNMVAEAQSTPNKNCKAPFDGTVTATATAYKLNTTNYNLDAILAFRLVGEDVNFTTEYQIGTISAGTLNSTFTTTFTGIPDGTYTLLVQDTTTKCVYPFEAAVTVAKTPSDIVITPTITPNHACEVEGEYTPWDGTLAVVASSEMFAGAQWVYKFYSVDSLGVHWYSSEDAEYGTVTAWDSLETGAYTVFAMDNVSGCYQDSIFAIPTENICAPEVSFESFNHNNKPFHFCLNTEDARICANATTTSDGCPATEYDYKWHVDCHDLNFTGNCINIPTDEVHCCTYTVTVTSIATGCKTVAPITVCIDPINTIEYLVNDEPFLASPRTVYNCVNKDVKIGIEPNGWEHAWWTNAHTTVMPDDDPEYDFVVGANTTKVDTMYSYCVNVIDTNGCPAMGVINLISLPVPVATVYDTACSCISITRNVRPVYYDGTVPGQGGQVINPDFPNQPWYPTPVERICYSQFVQQSSTVDEFEYTTDDKGYIHFSYNDTIFNGAVNGCDSVTIHNVVLMPTPTITGDVDYNFCEGTTIAEAIADLEIENANDTIIKIYDQVVELTDELEFSNCEMVEMTVMAISGIFNNGEDTCFFERTFNFIVNAAPEFTDEEIEVEEAYCANGEPVVTPIPAYDCNYCEMSVEYGDIMVDYEDNCDQLHLYVMETNHTVYADLGEITVVDGLWFEWTPRFAYDGKLLALVAHNICGYDTVYAELDIDSTVITINPIEICEGEALDIDAILGKHYDDVTAYMLYYDNQGTSGLIPPVAANVIDFADLYSSVTSNTDLTTINMSGYNISFEQGSGDYAPKYYANGHSARIYTNNHIVVTPTGDTYINNIKLNLADNDQSTSSAMVLVNVEGTATPISKSSNMFVVDGISTNNPVTFTPNTQIRIASIEVEYTMGANSDPVPTSVVAYQPGTPMTLDEDGVSFQIGVYGEVCDPIFTNITTITVNPLPTVENEDIPEDLCLANAATILENGIVSENATVEGWINYNATPTFFEGFENITNPSGLPTGWSVYDNDGDGYNWQQFVSFGDIYQFHAYEGVDAIGSASYINGVGALEPDNWLFTPAITLNGDNVLSFYVRGQNTYSYNNEYYSVYVLLAAQVNTSATPVATGVTTDVYDHVVVDLSEYDGQTVYVAFRHHETTDQYWLVLDNVAVYPLISDAEDLVDAIQNEPSAQIGYFVANDCGTDLVDLTVRILKPLAITAQPVLVCPDATLADVVSAANVVTNINNYLPSEVEVVYTVTVDGTEYMLDDDEVVWDYTMAYNDITVTATVQTKDGVESCGDASAPIVVSFKHSTFVAPTFKPACEGSVLSDFIATQPSWSGSDPAVGHWEVWGTGSNYETVNPDTYVMHSNDVPFVRYVWETECGVTEITDYVAFTKYNGRIYDAPYMEVTPTEITICENGTISETDLTLDVTYYGNEDSYETVYTLDGEPFTFDHVFDTPGEYTLNVKLDDNGEACGSTDVDVTIIVNPIPVPHAEGDTTICTDGTANFSVVNPTATSTYTWYYGDIELGTGTTLSVTFGEIAEQPTKATMTTSSTTITVDKQELYEFTVVENASGCPSTTMVNESGDPFSESVLTVKVSNLPQFIFYDKDGNKTHRIAAADGNAFTKYYWEVDKHCPNEDILVWVDFTIYHNDTLIANDYIGEYINTQELASVTGSSVNYWTHSDSIHWSPGSWTPGTTQPDYHKVFRYNASIPSTNPNNTATTNHFPNASMFTGNTNVYKDVYLYFLDDIDTVKKLIAPFRTAGEYKIVYRLHATDNHNIFMNPYYNHEYEEPMIVGGQNPFMGNQWLIAIDSIYIDVENPYIPSNNPSEELVTNPELAPGLSMEETVAPDMEVWPNPAPAVETTLKARVHNMNGNATVTLTNLTGKTVYVGETYIDNDNYYFEFNVTGLTVGSYIMTVRTDADIVTKKVIVARLAR